MKHHLNRGMTWLSLVPALLSWPALAYGADVGVSLTDRIAQGVVLLGGMVAGIIVLSRGRLPLQRRLLYALLINFATFTAVALAHVSYWGWLVVKALAPHCAAGIRLEDLLCRGFYWICLDHPLAEILEILLGQLGFAVSLTVIEYLAAHVFPALRRVIQGRLDR